MSAGKPYNQRKANFHSISIRLRLSRHDHIISNQSILCFICAADTDILLLCFMTLLQFFRRTRVTDSIGIVNKLFSGGWLKVKMLNTDKFSLNGFKFLFRLVQRAIRIIKI